MNPPNTISITTRAIGSATVSPRCRSFSLSSTIESTSSALPPDLDRRVGIDCRAARTPSSAARRPPHPRRRHRGAPPSTPSTVALTRNPSPSSDGIGPRPSWCSGCRRAGRARSATAASASASSGGDPVDQQRQRRALLVVAGQQVVGARALAVGRRRLALQPLEQRLARRPRRPRVPTATAISTTQTASVIERVARGGAADRGERSGHTFARQSSSSSSSTTSTGARERPGQRARPW